MQPQHILRPRRCLRDFIDIERRCIRRQDRAGLGDLIELAKNLLLHTHVLEYSLDDEVTVLQRQKFRRRRQPADPRRRHIGRNTPALGQALDRLLDPRHAFVERILFHFDDFNPWRHSAKRLSKTGRSLSKDCQVSVT